MARISCWFILLAVAGCEGSHRNYADVKEAVPAASAEIDGRQTKFDNKATSTAPGGELAGERKIIFVAEVAIVVDDFAGAEAAVPSLAKQFGGYLADVSVTRPTGGTRSGRWTVRVPVDRFDAFLDAVSKLGVPESRRQTAQDVTEEFVDLEARIKNSKRVEVEILKLLEERTGDIKDVLEVQARLGEVRGEIERMEGRLRYLQNQTALTTVTLAIREERDYRPPETPSFANRLRSGWSNSLVGLRVFGENAAVALAIAAPWLLLWTVILLPPFLYLRRRWKRYIADRSAFGPRD